HSTAYALIAYMTAYLKAHHPVEFMAALLCGDVDARNFKRKDSLVEHLEDCQRMGIRVLPPDINGSDAEFTVERGEVRFGLNAVKACGADAVGAIVAERREGGPFSDLFNFCERVDASTCSRAMIESLVKAGAFDSCSPRRSAVLAAVEKALTAGASHAADRRSGQLSLFDDLGEESAADAPIQLPNVPAWNERERLAYEKEVLGFYLSSHPLAEHQEVLGRYCPHTTGDLAGTTDRAEVVLGGMVASVRTAHVKKARQEGEPTKYVMFDLEDMQGIVRCIMWPTEYGQFGSLIQPDLIVVLRASVDRRGGGDEINLIVREVYELDSMAARCARRVRIRVDEALHTSAQLQELHTLAQAYPGECELQLELDLVDGPRVSLKSQSLKVATSPEFQQRVRELLRVDSFEIAFDALTPAAKKSKKPSWTSSRPS
ncbi:MAG TPA: OB-fold nucleic acid binding domain-containing protein, partial [Pirellulaceae bacterium]